MSKTLPIVVVVDESVSMSFENRINNLNNAFQILIETLNNNPKTRICARLKIITVSNTVKIGDGFLPINKIKDVRFKASGLSTPLNKGIIAAYDEIVNYVSRARAITPHPCYLPHIVIITDGEDSDMIEEEINEVFRLSAYYAGGTVDGERADILIAPYVLFAANRRNLLTDEKEKKALTYLDKIAKPYQGQALLIDTPDLFKDMIMLVANSLNVSANATGNTLQSILESLRADVREMTNENRSDVNISLNWNPVEAVEGFDWIEREYWVENLIPRKRK